jgi:hypothetical protein
MHVGEAQRRFRRVPRAAAVLLAFAPTTRKRWSGARGIAQT